MIVPVTEGREVRSALGVVEGEMAELREKSHRLAHRRRHLFDDNQAVQPEVKGRCGDADASDDEAQ